MNLKLKTIRIHVKRTSKHSVTLGIIEIHGEGFEKSQGDMYLSLGDTVDLNIIREEEKKNFIEVDGRSIEVPKGGYIPSGWYYGRQFLDGYCGKPGEIIADWECGCVRLRHDVTVWEIAAKRWVYIQ